LSVNKHCTKEAGNGDWQESKQPVKIISAFKAALKTSYTVLAKQKRCSLKMLLKKTFL